MILTVKARPGAKLSSLTRQKDGSWLARLKSPPVDGKANEELVRLVAAHFGCQRRDVRIRSGLSGRLKRVELPG